MYTPVTVELSSGGDSFKLSTWNHNEKSFRNINPQTDNIDSYFKKALDCKTHQAVLEFLQGMKENNTWNKFYHVHNHKYPGHYDIKGKAHTCSISKMISFVELRIKEKKSLHGSFDKIGRVLGRTFNYLEPITAIPFVGIIPGGIRMGIGAIQIVAGSALSLIFTIPAYHYQSENAKIIVQRSVKHVGNGACNIILGALLGTPGLGAYIYYN